MNKITFHRIDDIGIANRTLSLDIGDNDVIELNIIIVIMISIEKSLWWLLLLLLHRKLLKLIICLPILRIELIRLVYFKKKKKNVCKSHELLLIHCKLLLQTVAECLLILIRLINHQRWCTVHKEEKSSV